MPGPQDPMPDEIIPLAGDDVAHAAARIGDVAGVARNYVDVQVRNGLAGGGAGVDADIEAVGVVLPADGVAGDGDSVGESVAFIVGGLEP